MRTLHGCQDMRVRLSSAYDLYSRKPRHRREYPSAMSHSYLCAVSGQSIPVYSVEPTEVVVVLPNDTMMHGTWDGYGHILPSGVTNIQAAHDIQRYRTPEFHLQKRLALILGSDDAAAIEGAVKMIKARFFEYGTGQHAFAKLPTSAPCPQKGMLYKEKSQWRSPKHAPAKHQAPWLKPLPPEGSNVLYGSVQGTAPDLE